MKKLYAIISKDRHRDDYVYLFEGTKEEVEKQCDKVWEQDFGFKYDYHWCTGGGDYRVEFVEVKKLN